ncbi:hypothetical protein KN506_19070, partial [Acinetobacter baumannii]|uniref:hypothetical protein n=1 Tax=Acinetobacter baumannii TaxID=470 RepID=UPI001C054232
AHPWANALGYLKDIKQADLVFPTNITTDRNDSKRQAKPDESKNSISIIANDSASSAPEVISQKRIGPRPQNRLQQLRPVMDLGLDHPQTIHD